MKNLFKRFGLLLLAAAMILSIAIVGFASPGGDPTQAPTETPAPTPTPITTINLTKTVIIGENLFTPSANFEFEIMPKNGAPANGFTFLNGNNTVPVNQNTHGTFSVSLPITIDASQFPESGIYTYQVVEDQTDPVSGFVYDTNVYYAHVYLYANPDWVAGGSANPLVCYAVITTRSLDNPGYVDEVTEKVGDGRDGAIPFDNYYTKELPTPSPTPEWTPDPSATPLPPNVTPSPVPSPTPEITPVLTTIHDVVVNKVVTGNQGLHSRDFTFTIKLTNIQEHRQILIEKVGSVTINYFVNAKVGDNTDEQTLTLRHGEKFTIYGLLEGEKYQIIETQSDDYTGAISGDVTVGPLEANTDVDTGVVTVGTSDMNLTFTNNKGGTIPTGIFLNYKPYWIMGAVALVLAVVFLRKKRNKAVEDI